MKKIVNALLMAVIMLCATTVNAQRHDEGVYNQVASMEFKQWSFKPKNYYYSKVRKSKRVLGIKITWDEPGYGWHDKGEWVPLTNLYIPVIANPYAAAGGNFEAAFTPDNYVNEKWRQNINHRTAANVEAALYKDYSNTERKRWEDMETEDLITLSDRQGTLDFLTGAKKVTASERDDAIEQININFEAIRDEKQREAIREEYETLEEMVSTIDDAHMDNSKKMIALEKINNDYKRLAEYAKSYKEWEDIMLDMQDVTESLKKKKLDIKVIIGTGLGVLDELEEQGMVSISREWMNVVRMLELNWL